MKRRFQLRSERRADGWWIVDVPPGVEEMGPYDTRAEADEDRHGVQRWLSRNYKEEEKAK